MTTLTSTELGATGRYIRFVASALNNLGSQTVMSRCRPTGPGGGNIGYLYGKGGSGGAGPRLFLGDNSDAPRLSFGAHSSTTAKPVRNGANNSVVYNTWQDLAATWDGTLISSGIVVYVNGVNVSSTYTSGDNGTGAVADDSAHAVTLLNREGLGREFVGDVAWIAVWDRVLTTTEMNLARSDGPLEVPDGLVLLWANQSDLGPNSLTPESRSTYVAGALPTNTALGGEAGTTPVAFTGTVGAQSWVEDSAITPLDLSTYFTGDLTPFSYAVTTGTLPAGLSLNSSTGVISGTPTTPASAVSIVVTATDASSNAANTNAFNITITAATPAITLREDYERSSVNLAGSSVSGTGDDAVITIKPRMQETEAAPTNPRWLEPSVRVDNVNGLRPSFKFTDYAATAAANKYHGAPWQTTRRPMFSYDRLTWHYFDTQTITASEIQFRHGTAFTADTVYISRERQVSVTQMGQWLEDLAAAHPTKIAPTATASAFTPTLTSWPAQSFIAGEYATQLDELGRTVPQTPFYAAQINDIGLSGTKRLALMTAGIHAGEDTGDWAFQRTVEYLLSDASAAVAMRTHYRILLYPMINAPGRAGGGWRGSFTQGTGGADDANRGWSTVRGLEIVSIPRAAMDTDMAAVVPDWVLDYHGAFSRDYGLYVNAPIDETFRARASAEFGTAVEDMGVAANDGLGNYFADVVGAQMSVVLEHGAETPQSDAALVSWGGAVVRTLESMRADGFFYNLAAPGAATASGAAALSAEVSLAAVGITLASSTAGLVANVSISASALAQAAGSAGLSADVLLAGSGAAMAAGNATLAAELSLLAAGAAEASGAAALTGGAGGDLSAVGGAVAGGSANLALTVSLSGAGLAEALGSAALSGGAGGDLAGAGGAVAGGAGALVATVSVAAAGSAVAGGVAVLDGGAAGDLSGSGGAVAGGSALVVATVSLTAAGFVQAMGAGALAVQVPLSAAGGAVAGGSGSLVSGDVLLLISNPRWRITSPNRRWEIT